MFETNSYSFLALILAIVAMRVAIATLAMQGKVDANMITVLWAIRATIAAVASTLAWYGITKKQSVPIALTALIIAILAISLEMLFLLWVVGKLIWAFIEWFGHILIHWYS